MWHIMLTLPLEIKERMMLYPNLPMFFLNKMYIGLLKKTKNNANMSRNCMFILLRYKREFVPNLSYCHGGWCRGNKWRMSSTLISVFRVHLIQTLKPTSHP
jgi:hypothetical protein